MSRPIYVWTVNKDEMMRWSIGKNVDGVITDDPKRFLEVCEEWERGRRDVSVGFRTWLQTIWIYIMVLLFGAVFRWKYKGKAVKQGGVALKA